jgi:putative NADH-flavin reductase
MVGGAGLLQADEHTRVQDIPSYPKVFVNVSNDHERAFALLQKSHLDWTILFCPQIVGGDAAGNYLLAKDYLPETGQMRITTCSIGHFCNNEIENNEYIHSRVGNAARG